MKKTNKRIFTVILCTLLLSASLAACSEKDPSINDTLDSSTQWQQNNQTQVQQEQKTEKPSSPSVQEPNNGSNNIQLDTYKEQISYYMNLTETLQADLVKLKEETYIEECEYQLQIESLEQTIQDLKDTIAAMSNNKTDPPSANTQVPSNDTLSSKTDYKYTTSNGEVTVTGYIGNDIDVKIPALINGNPVVCIGESAFQGKQIRSVEIPSGIKKIDWFAFSGCTTLESITVPASVMSVGYGAFDYCPKSLTVKCNKGSYIEAYAKSWGIKTVTE